MQCWRIVTSLPKPARRATSGIGRSVRSRLAAERGRGGTGVAVSLHGGGFARVVVTKEVVDAAG